MSAHPQKRLTVDEFLVWAVGQPGRYELVDGEVYAMSPQRARHARAKFAVQSALQSSILSRGLPCQMFPDGMTVRIDQSTAFEPDALVTCGERLDHDAIEVPAPVIVVEVLSPGTSGVDTGHKLAGYFRVPSILHYLIVDPKKRLLIHHRRGDGDLIETRLVFAGSLDLAPPGLAIALADLFAES